MLREKLLELERLGREASAGRLAAPRALRHTEVVLRAGAASRRVDIERVEAMLRDPRPLAVPGAPAWVLGAVRVGRRMVALLDPAWVMDEPGAPAAHGFPLAMAFRVDGGGIAMGVDSVEGVFLENALATQAQDVAPLDVDALAERLRREAEERGETRE